MMDQEHRLDEAQVAAALGGIQGPLDLLSADPAVRWRGAQTLARRIAWDQPATHDVPLRDLMAYQRLLEDRIIEVNSATVRRAAVDDGPMLFVDSLAHELACVVELPTFEHWQAGRARVAE